MKVRRTSMIVSGALLATLISVGPVSAVENLKFSKQELAELREKIGDRGGRTLEERPGEVVKASEAGNLPDVPGIRPTDEIKWVQDAWMGRDFAVNMTLAEQWEEVIGGSAPEWTGKVAPSVKVGMVITQDNYKEIEGLEELMPPAMYARLAKGAFSPIKEIRVGETDQFFPTHGYIELTKKHDYEAEGFAIADWKGGLPFPKPETGREVLINYMYRYWVDSGHFRFDWHLLGSGDSYERTVVGQMYFMRFVGRTVEGPKPVYGKAYDDVLESISTLVVAPKDLKGTALNRTRKIDATQTDSLQMYLPAMRRIRRMSGRDTQDPLVGTDVTWDDYVGFYQQVTTDNTEVKLVGEGEILHPQSYTTLSDEVPPGYREPPYIHNVSWLDEEKKIPTFKKWQRRPVWIIDVISTDDSYMYSKRRMWIDKELPNVIHVEAWDQRDNKWRVLRNSMYHNPTNGDASAWDWTDFADVLNEHRTTWIFDWESFLGLTPDYFDTRFLTKQTE